VSTKPRELHAEEEILNGDNQDNRRDLEGERKRKKCLIKETSSRKEKRDRGFE